MRPLSNLPGNLPPNPVSDEQWEEMIRQTARSLPYPPTPNVVERVTAQLAKNRTQKHSAQWRPLWVTAIILALLIGLWSVPPVRAAILEFLQIGAVRIWLVEPTPTPVPTAEPAGVTPVNTRRPTPTPLVSLFNLAGKTTLAEAEAQVDYSIPLPTYPADLGQPDGVFVQDMNGAVVVLVWLNPERPDEAQYTLHILSNNAVAEKMNPRVVMTTTVNGNPAAWTVGPYLLVYGEGRGEDWASHYLVTGRVLIWEADGLTYRLESNLPLEEAIRMAESLE
jgi:hypothetical protein